MAEGADLSARRREVMRRRLAESGLTARRDATASVRDGTAPTPLSDGQRRMWFLQTRDPGDTSLTISVGFRLDGSLDDRRLRSAFDAVVARHEILRTTYRLGADGEPQQVSHADTGVPWTHHDISDLSEHSRERRVEVLARREYGRPFDLATETPVRVALVRCESRRHVVILTVHHICWDDNSWDVLFREVNEHYNSAGAATPSDVRRQYVDVEVVGTAGHGDPRGLDYWRAHLTPLPEQLTLPAPRAGAPMSGGSRRRTRHIPASLIDRVSECAQEHYATTFMVLLATFDMLVHRYTGSEDFLVAVPVVNRRGADADVLIGYFGNTILLRSTVTAFDTVNDVIESVRTVALDGFTHQTTPIDRVIREINPDRVAGRDGLRQSVHLSFTARSGVDGFALDDVESSVVDLGRSAAHEPLAFAVVIDSEGAHLDVEFMPDVVDADVVDLMVDNYVELLSSAVSAPDRPVGELDMLGDTARSAMMSVSLGRRETPVRDVLHAIVERSASAHPEAIAVATDDAEVSYAELNTHANRLARWLVGAGVGPDDVVAILLPGSLDFVVTMLAVLKAGGAYLPIDPTYPAERIEYLLGDASPVLALDTATVATAQAQAQAYADGDLTDADRRAPLRPENLAYVIYTSGSTGKPKGVPVSHAAITDHLAGGDAAGTMTADDRLLQTSSVSFDASLFEMFSTLALGARLVIPRTPGFGDIAYVADLVTRQGVTALHMVPSMLGTFLLLPEVSEWQTLQHVIVGGEALSGEVADKFASVFDATLRNNYGPTEAVVASTHYSVDGPQGSRIVPIGAANRNVAVYILDQSMNLTPAGVVGEIYLGGPQLARGYLNRPVLSAERFVADPFSTGQRLYRTGDLARRDSAAQIEFVGRVDEQVKIRGYRIEPGEVQAALTSHPSVAHAVVLTTERPGVGAALVAYVIADPALAERPTGAALDLDAIRTHVASVLPDHMVPSAFAEIPEVPLTPHGKLDRRALPVPATHVARAHREPRSATEIALASLFGEIFAKDAVSVDDSFFDLGGHSLLATRLVAQVRARFGVDIDVRVPFETPTVAGMAALIDGRSSSSTVARPPLVRRPRPDFVPLSYSQQAMWFQRRFEGASRVGNIPLAARIAGPLDTAALAQAVNDVVARHEALRTTFPEHDGVPYQSVNPATAIDVPVVDLRADGAASPADAGSAGDAMLASAAEHAFDVESEMLIRPQIFVLADDSHVLSLLVHHLVADHWSARTLFRDVVTAYRTRVETGVEPRWEPDSIRYTDYALWQREMFDQGSEYGRTQLDYWRDRLAGLPDEIAVAHDRPRPPVLGKRGEVVRFVVPAQMRAGLARLAEACGATEFMVCQAAVSTLLHRLGGGDDIAVGSPIAGRSDDATTDMIGLFANMVVLRNDFGDDPTVRAVVRRARSAALGAYSHADVPIDRLVEALNPTRSLSRNPLFQTMIHFREQDWAAGEADGGAALDAAGETTMSSVDFDFDIALLDMSVNFFESRGGYGASIIVNSDLYDRQTGEAMSRRLLAILDAFTGDPERRVADIDIIDASERAAIGRWEHGPALIASACDARALHDRIQTVDADTVALVCGAITVTYGDIRRADRRDLRTLVVDSVLNLVAALSDTDGCRVRIGTDGDGTSDVELDRVHVRVTPQIPMDEADVRLVAATPGTVEFAAETVGALAAGATVVLLDESRRSDPTAMTDEIVRNRVTTVIAPADRLGSLAQSGVSILPSVRHWRALTAHPVPALAALLTALSDGSEAQFAWTVDEYGGEVLSGPLDGDGGRPAVGTRVWITDPDTGAGPVPPGVTGWVHVSSVDGGAVVRTSRRARWTATGRLIVEPNSSAVTVLRSGGDGAAPTTHTETVLVTLIEQLLDITGVTVDDGFFALGGDSVISVQWAVRATQAGLTMTPQMVFEHYSIGELAAAVDAHSAEVDSACVDSADVDSAQTPDVTAVTSGEPAAPQEPATSVAQPMSASGLDADALAAVGAAWKSRR